MTSPKTTAFSALLSKSQEADLRRLITECVLEANRSLHDQVRKVETKINKIEKDVNDLQQKMAAAELNAEQNTSKVTLLHKQQGEHERNLINLLWERSQTTLRVQNVDEEEGEIISALVTELLSPLAEMPPTSVAMEIKAAYRVSTRYTQANGLPREIRIKLKNEDLRGKILQNANRQPLNYQEKPFKILKDVPQLIRAKRQAFKDLSTKLIEKGLNYRWLIPQGLSFTYKGTVIKITSEKAKVNFLEKYKDDFSQKETPATTMPKSREAKEKAGKKFQEQKMELRSKKK